MERSAEDRSSEDVPRPNGSDHASAREQLETDGLVYSRTYHPLEPVGADPDAWDDTELIAAYDAAVRSYNKPAARAGRSEPPPRPAATPSAAPSRRSRSPMRTPAAHGPAGTQPPAGGTSAAAAAADGAERVAQKQSSSTRRVAADSSSSVAGTAPGAAPGQLLLVPPPPPVSLLPGAVRDEELEQLLMAWYEAGYRAGRYVARLQQSGTTDHAI